MRTHNNDCFLCRVPNVALFDETARRLLLLYEKKFGIALGRGNHEFEFAFQNGIFLGINKRLGRTLYCQAVRPKKGG